ncbi:4'-phosphopantetheinyl transferase superfamily protein [Polluticaenibacter yanchengensis]|uniref:Enterobactin synthase component D n=1 Tax=Polluticaenibacter yanchengensis TaxID=3014562 RepID=A0ABT4UPK0_9BACT|nr:4'-phosphopantetheinyl transferase superfamily protein [Chitinophagaceae bacterium LY-5]
MPVFYKNRLNQHCEIIIWKIEEDEAFFTRFVQATSNIANTQKRLQHLAGRYSLIQLQLDFPLNDIVILNSKKPVLNSGKYHFSISHCKNLAAAIIHNQANVGIDIEYHTPKTNKVQHKFVNEHETTLLQNLPEIFPTIFWSTKESMFKWLNDTGVDFREHLLIRKVIPITANTGTIEVTYNRAVQTHAIIHYIYWNDFVLTYTIQ